MALSTGILYYRIYFWIDVATCPRIKQSLAFFENFLVYTSEIYQLKRQFEYKRGNYCKFVTKILQLFSPDTVTEQQNGINLMTVTWANVKWRMTKKWNRSVSAEITWAKSVIFFLKFERKFTNLGRYLPIFFFFKQVFDQMLKRMSYRRQKRWWNAYMLFYTRLDVQENSLVNNFRSLSLSK